MHVVITRHIAGDDPDAADREGIRSALAAALISHGKRSVAINSLTRLDDPPRIAVEAALSDAPGQTADEAFDGIDWSSIPQST